MQQDKDTVIAFESVWKQFYKHEDKTLKDLFPHLFNIKKSDSVFWALQDLNLDIKRGETVGVVGRNGSGKSTLLKLIASVTKPTRGKVSVKGRVVPLIELGAGFHHELTGRENTYLNGVILGLDKKDIEAQFDSIVEYAGLSEFIDTPVKHYSSGMYVRLGFAIAVHSQPEILLVDEILAVGDIAFQEKCLSSIQAFSKNRETTVLMVAHSPALIERFCNKVIWLEQGVVKMAGDPKVVMPRFLEASVAPENVTTAHQRVEATKVDEYDKPLQIVAATSIDKLGKEKKLIEDEPITIRMVLQAHRDVKEYNLGVMIKTLSGELIWERNSFQDKKKFTPLKATQKHTVEITIPPIMNSGTYTITLALAGKETSVWQWLEDFITLRVARSIATGSVINHSVSFKEVTTK